MQRTIVALQWHAWYKPDHKGETEELLSLNEMKSASDEPPVERQLTAQLNLYYDLLLPAARPAPLLVALHGYGAGKWHATREARLIASEGFAIASLQGPHQHLREPKQPGGPLRFGFGWLTSFRPEDSIAVHHHALLDIVESLDREGAVDRQRVFLLGFSQSCALNYRFAFTYPEVLRGVIGICGGLPGDWKTSELYHETSAAVFHLAGTRDEFYPPARVANYEEQLRQRAGDVDFRSYDAGHEIAPAMRADIREWLRQKCDG
ncbi:MAG TPA: dienelactone hydrolase family protein [Pyrinomonadaceae bacterium]|nr:dienelactone hydrolase family protein [Pyrinomonadaceae bacterium]